MIFFGYETVNSHEWKYIFFCEMVVSYLFNIDSP